MEVNKKNFLEAVRGVTLVANGADGIMDGECIHFGEGRMEAFSRPLTIRREFDTGLEAVAVEAGPLLDVVKAMPGDTISLDVENKQGKFLRVKAGRSRVTLPLRESNPPESQIITDYVTNDMGVPIPDWFFPVITKAIQFTNPSDNRLAFQSVHFTDTCIEAIEGYRAFRHTADMTWLVGGPGNVCYLGTMLMKALKAGTFTHACSIGTGELVLSGDGVVLVVHPIEIEYLKTAFLFGDLEEEPSPIIFGKLEEDLLSRILIFGTKDDANLEVSVKGDKALLRLTRFSDTLEEIVSVESQQDEEFCIHPKSFAMGMELSDRLVVNRKKNFIRFVGHPQQSIGVVKVKK